MFGAKYPFSHSIPKIFHACCPAYVHANCCQRELFCTLVAKSKAAEHRTHSKTRARIKRRKLRIRFGVRRCYAAFLGAGSCQLHLSVELAKSMLLPLAHQNSECLLEI